MTVSELAQAAGVHIETVRYYERRGLLPEPQRQLSGYRAYPVTMVTRLRFIKNAQELGFSLAEIADAREGLHFARQDRLVVRLITVQALASFSVGATSALLVVLAQEHYRLPPAGFGSFILAIGVGALLGPLLLGLFTRDVRHPRWLFVPYVIRGVGDLLLAVTRSVAAAWFLLFVYGLNTSSGMVIYQTAVQRHVPDAVRGRVFTWLDVVWNVMRMVSLGLGG
jgi:DNA-binding transcriptional MerR regulator